MGGVAAVQIVAAILATALVVRYEEKRSLAMLEAGLVEHSAMVTSVIELPDIPTESTIVHRELLTLPKGDVFVLSDAEGKVISASGDWRPTDPLPSESRSFTNMRVGGHRYRMLIERNVPMFDDNPATLARLPKLTLVYGARMSVLEEHEEQVTWIAAFIGLAILLVSLAATAWVVQKGLQPLMALANRAGRIDESNWALEASDTDREAEELAPLSTALTRLVERLRMAFMRERQFSADAAHEMKTAIAIVKSTLQLTLERPAGAAEYRLGIERALEDTERMQELAIGMLQLAKIEGLAIPGQTFEPVSDVLEAVRDVERELTPLLASRKMTLRVRGAESPISAGVSSEDLNMILKNLIENAIHYSEDGAYVDVEIESRERNCWLKVRDRGCGIPANALPHIFERFYRGDASRSRDSGGAGLGLAIIQAIVRRAGGSVTAESSLGNGSLFTVRLPQGEPAGAKD
jgi:signal transduction histidine kinase